MCSNMGGGISNKAFNAQSTSSKIATIKSTQQALTKAKTAETKAYKAYQSAEGGVRMSPNAKIRNKRRKAATKAYHKYAKARDNRQSLEQRLERYKNTYSGQLILF